GMDVGRVYETNAQVSRTIEFALVVFRSPNSYTRPLIYFYWCVKNDSRGRVAVVERRRVNERFERRAGLAQRLRGAVELALVERKAPDHREHASCPWILYHHI